MASIDVFRKNLESIPDGHITKLLADYVLSEVIDLADYNENDIYSFGQRVFHYDDETKKNMIVECVYEGTTGVYNPSLWKVITISTAAGTDDGYSGAPAIGDNGAVTSQDNRVISTVDLASVTIGIPFDKLKDILFVWKNGVHVYAPDDYTISTDSLTIIPGETWTATNENPLTVDFKVLRTVVSETLPQYDGGLINPGTVDLAALDASVQTLINKIGTAPLGTNPQILSDAINELNSYKPLIADNTANIIALTLAVELISGGAIAGMTENIVIENLANLNDITLTSGYYDAVNHKLYV